MYHPHIGLESDQQNGVQSTFTCCDAIGSNWREEQGPCARVIINIPQCTMIYKKYVEVAV